MLYFQLIAVEHIEIAFFKNKVFVLVQIATVFSVNAHLIVQI